MNLSIIIPMYNCEQYVEKCICSLLDQTYLDFEIIVVDDGSTDSSLQIVEALLANNDRCTIVAQENRGASGARNLGIQYAKGKWISFIDSDDYVASDYLEELVSNSSGCDLLVSGLVFMEGEKEIHRMVPPNEEFNVVDLKRNKGCFLDYTISPVGKIFRKGIIDKFNLRFDESLSKAEDRDFNIEYLLRADKIRLISYAGYYYQTLHEGSLSKSSIGLCGDILYWNKMYRLLDGTNEEYLAHRLFYFIVDAVSDYLQRKDYVGAFSALRESRSLFDRSFLRRHLKIVKAPEWQKALMRAYLC